MSQIKTRYLYLTRLWFLSQAPLFLLFPRKPPLSGGHWERPILLWLLHRSLFRVTFMPQCTFPPFLLAAVNLCLSHCVLWADLCADFCISPGVHFCSLHTVRHSVCLSVTRARGASDCHLSPLLFLRWLLWSALGAHSRTYLLHSLTQIFPLTVTWCGCASCWAHPPLSCASLSTSHVTSVGTKCDNIKLIIKRPYMKNGL